MRENGALRASRLRTATRPQPPDSDGFYRECTDPSDWRQGDIFRSVAGSVDRQEVRFRDDSSYAEGGPITFLRLLNAAEDLWGDESWRGLSMLVSHTCDFGLLCRFRG